MTVVREKRQRLFEGPAEREILAVAEGQRETEKKGKAQRETQIKRHMKRQPKPQRCLLGTRINTKVLLLFRRSSVLLQLLLQHGGSPVALHLTAVLYPKP